LFPVRPQSNEQEENEREGRDQSRLNKAWGKRHQSPHDFLKARDGDHAMIPFECDWCIFRKLRGTSPDPGEPKDQLLMACIRRINLDAFWSRAKDTVRGNKDKLKLSITLSESVGLAGPFVHKGPLPSFDHCGYETAIEMVLYSRRPGKYSKKYTQIDTIRKLRSCYGNQVRASPQANATAVSLGDQKGRYQRFSTDPCSSFWFYRFIEGIRNRMGQDWRPNKALSLDLLLRLLSEIELRVDSASSPNETNRWIVFHTYTVVAYVASLRGSEGFLLDLSGLRRNRNRGGARYVVIALLGKLKGEHHDLAHLLPSVMVTTSGIKVAETVSRLIELKQSQGFIDGPAISDTRGRVFSTKTLDDALVEVLEEVYDTNPEMFPPDISNKESLPKHYQVFRSLRRTSDTRAIEKKVSQVDIDVVNRWQTVERAKGKRPNMPMRQHYAQLDLLIEPFLRYTGAM
jgi:hypothetical protein